MCKEKKAIEVIAIAICGASFALLSAFVIAILSANGLTIEFKPETGNERSVALSAGKDSDPT
jgi:ABC-type phosphate/phosphonate transport system permease subunit